MGGALLAYFEGRCVGQPTGCLVWTGRLTPKGYAVVSYEGRSARLHRLVTELRQGPIAANTVVLHTCDNPACIAADHLKLGSQLENIADRNQKGRARGPRGERAPSAKLTAEAVRRIRADPRTLREIAADHGISQASASKVRLRRNWAHVPD